jgi:hypothetical protein
MTCHRGEGRLARIAAAVLGLLLLAACEAIAPGSTRMPAARPPNILFVLADDLGIDSTRFYPAYDPERRNVSLPTLE